MAREGQNNRPGRSFGHWGAKFKVLGARATAVVSAWAWLDSVCQAEAVGTNFFYYIYCSIVRTIRDSCSPRLKKFLKTDKHGERTYSDLGAVPLAESRVKASGQGVKLKPNSITLAASKLVRSWSQTVEPASVMEFGLPPKFGTIKKVRRCRTPKRSLHIGGCSSLSCKPLSL